jgi:hypothetical protein
MKIYQLEILEPGAERLLEELAKLKLIRLQAQETPRQAFLQLLSTLRTHTNTPSPEEIAQEVGVVRKKRYARKPDTGHS